jgi:hypothetical protein
MSKQTNTLSPSPKVFKVRNFRTRTSADSDSDSDVRKALPSYISIVHLMVEESDIFFMGSKFVQIFKFPALLYEMTNLYVCKYVLPVFSNEFRPHGENWQIPLPLRRYSPFCEYKG